MPLDELSSRKTDYADGARLGPLFGRQGEVAEPSAGTTTPLRCSAIQGSLQGRAGPYSSFFCKIVLAGAFEEAFGFRACRGVTTLNLAECGSN